MKSIIIYGTKYGCAEKAAKMLKSKMSGDVQLVNIIKEDIPSLDGYGTVIFGGSIYMGKIQKQITNYIDKNLPMLLKKRIGLFICAGSPDPAARIKELETSFPSELFSHAITKEMFGYEICFEKLNFLDKRIMRMVSGSKESSFDLSEEKIETFAKAIS